jgi:hypothetical protein
VLVEVLIEGACWISFARIIFSQDKQSGEIQIVLMLSILLVWESCCGIDAVGWSTIFLIGVPSLNSI